MTIDFAAKLAMMRLCRERDCAPAELVEEQEDHLDQARGDQIERVRALIAEQSEEQLRLLRESVAAAERHDFLRGLRETVTALEEDVTRLRESDRTLTGELAAGAGVLADKKAHLAALGATYAKVKAAAKHPSVHPTAHTITAIGQSASEYIARGGKPGQTIPPRHMPPRSKR